MSGEALVSIIVRTFNRSMNLARAIESIRQQTYKNIEIVVIDDASTDDTMIVLEALKKNDNRIVVYSNIMGKGSSGALQSGLKYAKGDFIAFLDDDDDEYFNNKIEYEIDKFNTDKALDVVVSGVRSAWCVNNSSDWIKIEFKPNKIFQPCAVMCRKEVFDTVNVVWGNMEWRDLAFQIYINNLSVFFANQKLFKINKSVNSMGAHSLKRYGISLANAKRYFNLSQGKDGHEIFKAYLANRYKCVANMSFRKGLLFNAVICLLKSFLTERKLSNLIPFT